ncbi:hypothetical protein TIFTF001_046761 [Ficus carica]|uniref:Uncharacterized protein n=1 Tax=Ficus carica TaxID=3494 RepID=A0AA87ZBP1_FICCA|nr:hypothetical protein TIFTF001_046759 [Ficus carica]GMN33974.1 hypothetical protein TIFTF001_046761 [Ficus carica]
MKSAAAQLGIEICSAVHLISSILQSMASQISPSIPSELLTYPEGPHTTIFVVGVATTTASCHQKPLRIRKSLIPLDIGSL